MAIKLRERKHTDNSGCFTVRSDSGKLNVVYDDCPMRRGISPRFRRSEALQIAKLIARYLSDLEASGGLPFAALDEAEQSPTTRPGWQRGSGQG